MKEIVIISGKGGTGKTSIVSAFAALAPNPVMADCDVDAADLHLILEPDVRRKEKFTGGKQARILQGHCTACGKCEEVCRFDAVFFDGPGNGKTERTFRVDPIACEGCGVCHWFCDYDAIEFKEVVNGHWFISETRFGPMVHAKLGIAAENSGKLVSLVRENAKSIAGSGRHDYIIVDGPPGIGCPVIASITGAGVVVVVTEPTLSGVHDLDRVAQLTRHFNIPAFTIVNKCDLNPELTRRIEADSRNQGVEFAGKVNYDPDVVKAQLDRKSIVEIPGSETAQTIRELWSKIKAAADRHNT
jgi:MinD superfamily P-loop ATPase